MGHEKVKLPKFVCDWLDRNQKILCGYPISDICRLMEVRDTIADVSNWLFRDENNQWKLIDALRYGYKPESEQLYYVRFIKGDKGSFLNAGNFDTMVFNRNDQGEHGYRTKFTMDEIIAIDPRYKAFAVPVEEVEADD